MSFSFASDRILSKIDKILTSFLSSELLDLLLLFIVFCAIINPSSKLLNNSLISPERRGWLIEKGNKKPYDVIDSQRSQRYERSNFFSSCSTQSPRYSLFRRRSCRKQPRAHEKGGKRLISQVFISNISLDNTKVNRRITRNHSKQEVSPCKK